MSRSTRAAGAVAGGLAAAVLATIVAPSARLHAQPASPPTAIDARQPGIDVQLTASAVDRTRILTAAQEALARYTEWLGPSPADAIVIVKKPWHDATGEGSASLVVDVAWRSAPATMDLESQVAYGVARQWWPGALTDPDTLEIVNGISWYLQSRVVDRLFDLSFHVPGYSFDGVRFFGDAVPWTFPLLALDRWTAGLGRTEFVRASGSGVRWPRLARRSPPELSSKAQRAAFAVGTLERFVGWPALQGALRAVAERAARGPVTRQEIEDVIASTLGQNLSWFFAQAFDAGTHYSYAVESVDTRPASGCTNGPCRQTKVNVVRSGNGLFTGSAEPGESMFDSGDAMMLRVRFADGQSLTARWDGRAVARTFEFESDASAVAAHLDPDRVLLLDENYVDNEVLLDVRTEVPVRKWVAYWVVWLQGAMLDYGLLF